MAKTTLRKISKKKLSVPEGTPPPSRPDRSSLRGFASMSPERRKALGSKGGKTAHEKGTANKFTSKTASLAGRLPHMYGTAHQWTSEEASEAGRKSAKNQHYTQRRKRAKRISLYEWLMSKGAA